MYIMLLVYECLSLDQFPFLLSIPTFSIFWWQGVPKFSCNFSWNCTWTKFLVVTCHLCMGRSVNHLNKCVFITIHSNELAIQCTHPAWPSSKLSKKNSSVSLSWWCSHYNRRSFRLLSTRQCMTERAKSDNKTLPFRKKMWIKVANSMLIWEHLSILYKAVDPSSLRNKRIL